MILQERIQLMSRLGQYMLGNDPEWLAIQESAYRENQWFIPEFIEQSVQNIATHFLNPALLADWVAKYSITEVPINKKKLGLVMAGNIPLVGFHDFLCVFMSGHHLVIKASTKDEILIKHLIQKLSDWHADFSKMVSFSVRLLGCDAYIATGSNNSSRYFDYYFGKFPHIIRRNRTSIAILDNTETGPELDALANDIQLYFGLGCRNVTKIFVPKEYNFIPLLDTLRKYEHFKDFHKYLHNFDYHLALLIMGNRYYMNNDSVIFTENISPFSPVSQVHYEFYQDRQSIIDQQQNNPDVQCIVGHGNTPFGMAQSPSLNDYADGVDTMEFLVKL